MQGSATWRRRRSITGIWITMILVVLDGSLANLALPTIAHELGTSAAASIWVVNAYQIAITMLLLPLASLGEIAGYRRVYKAGTAIFVIGSICCCVSDTITTLALSRLFQGFGAAAIMAVNGALVRFTYPRAKLGKMLSYNALIVAIASAAGPTIAAILLSVASWRWLFAINIPLGLLAMTIGWRCLPDTDLSNRRFDWMSATLNAATFASIFLVSSAVAHQNASISTVVVGAAGSVATLFLYRRSRSQTAPMMPLDLIGIPILRLSYAASICAFGAQMMALLSLPFLLPGRFHYSHAETGLLITALPVGVAMAAPLAGRLIEKVPAGTLGAAGLSILATAYTGLFLCDASTPTPIIGIAIGACGFGFGLFQAPNNRTMIGSGPPERAGAAAGMQAVARLIGQTLGAIATALIFRTAGPLSSTPLIVAASLGALAAIFSASRLRLRLRS